jgi:hypothetical protein
MKATDIIRNILDTIDGIEAERVPIEAEVVELEPVATAEITTVAPADDMNHFKQIVDVVSNGIGGKFGNSPNEQYSTIDAVTVDAGGGINGPKHPHDLRVKDPPAQLEHKSFKDYLNERGI